MDIKSIRMKYRKKNGDLRIPVDSMKIGDVVKVKVGWRKIENTDRAGAVIVLFYHDGHDQKISGTMIELKGRWG